jgi:hypothetical protein
MPGCEAAQSAKLPRSDSSRSTSGAVGAQQLERHPAFAQEVESSVDLAAAAASEQVLEAEAVHEKRANACVGRQIRLPRSGRMDRDGGATACVSRLDRAPEPRRLTFGTSSLAFACVVHEGLVPCE